MVLVCMLTEAMLTFGGFGAGVWGYATRLASLIRGVA